MVLEPDQRVNKVFDACYVPREIYVTGEIDAHDVGQLADGRPVFVNTLYNCLATPSERHSFTPIWKPPFISKIVKEDRCHLNGLAMEDGVPRYVTAVSKSDTIDGWRDRRFDGGILIDVATGETVIGGLSMPHSPRIYGGKLWLLNSGTGEIGWIERGASAEESKFHALVFCPGYVRGLAFHGKYAFVGLSKPRYRRFEGLALDRKLAEADSEAWCGVQVIDLNTGACVHWFRIDGPVAELYDVGVVPDVKPQDMIEYSEKRVEIPSSTLQDVRAGRPMELDALDNAVIDIARLTGVPTPSLDIVLACANLLNRRIIEERWAVAPRTVE